MEPGKWKQRLKPAVPLVNFDPYRHVPWVGWQWFHASAFKAFLERLFLLICKRGLVEVPSTFPVDSGPVGRDMGGELFAGKS